MLVLCGSTYPKRLWCVWELFTLLSFSSLDHARDRITFAVLESNEGREDLAGLKALMSFDVVSSRCYDPNEQNRLLEIIRGAGDGVFNTRIRNLAASFYEAQLKKVASSSSRAIKAKSTKSRSAMAPLPPSQRSQQMEARWSATVAPLPPFQDDGGSL